MEVQYKDSNYKGEETTETQRIADFLYEELLYEEHYRSISKDKIRLEDQPKKVVEALGRLVEVLLGKGIIDLENLKYIAQCSWGKKSDTLALKKEE